MGGKRTKNNTKPSSSSRSAELLGNAVPTMFGFATMDSTVVPIALPSFVQIDTAHGTDDSSATLEDNYQIVLRKMQKKDPTTKTKALLEFIELINQADAEVVKATLPHWPRLYWNLSTDADHRVRETAQQAHAALATKAGKSLAPFLRQMAPAWISSQYDTYAPAASVATQSFNTTFPQSKLQEVFVFCEDELIDYFVTNLTVHTAITLSNPKSHTPEECENRYQRVIISSLRGYTLYLSKLPEENLRKCNDKNAKLLGHQKFWTYYKHKTAAIRAAWFEVITGLLQYAPFLIETHRQQLTTTAFQFLDETDATVVSHIWSSVVLSQTVLDDWHTYLNFDKAVFPKLYKVLRTGGSGNAACVFPHMLPLVSKFTWAVLGDKLFRFYNAFFENINEGLKTVQSSRSDVSAISQAYYEVFQFIVMQTLKEEQLSESERTDFCLQLMRNHLLQVIVWCINAETSCTKYIFHNIALLLDHWCQHSAKNRTYELLLAEFWDNLYRVVQDSVTECDNLTRITSAHVELVQNLKRTSHKRVNFSAEIATPMDAVDGTSVADHANRFERQLHQLVYKICQLYGAKITVDREPAYIVQLEYLVRVFQCAAMFEYLTDGSPSARELFDSYARWLQDDKLQSEYVVELILILYKYLAEEEKVSLLSKWIKVSNKTVRRWIILRALSHPLCQDRNIHVFLSLPEVTACIVENAQSVSDGHTKDNMVLLQKCFLTSQNGDMLVDPDTSRRMIDIIGEPLTDENRTEQHDECASFLAQIMPVVCGDTRQRELQRALYLRLLQFSTQHHESDHLSEDTLWEVTTAWQDALASEDLLVDDALLEQSVVMVGNELQLFSKAAKTFSLEQLEKLAENSVKLMGCSTEHCKRDKTQRQRDVNRLLEKVFRYSERDDQAKAEPLDRLAVYIELLNGNLITTHSEYTLPITSTEFDVALRETLVRAYYLLTVLFKLSCNVSEKQRKNATNDQQEMETDEPDPDGGDGEENLLESWTELARTKLLSIMYRAAIGDTILQNSDRVDTVIETLILNIQEKLTLMMRRLPAPILAEIKGQLFQLANEHGLLWAKCLTTLLATEQYEDLDNGPILLYEDASTAVNSDNLITYINILQTLSCKMKPKSLPIAPNLFENYFDIIVKLASAKSLIENHFSSDYNEPNDRKIIGNTLIVLHELISRQSSSKLLLYNRALTAAEETTVFLDIEAANLLSVVLRSFGSELDIAKWDFIRIALTSWMLTASKSYANFRSHNISQFIVAIFRMFSALVHFFKDERNRSSTELLINVIEEWENVFAKDTNIVFLKIFIGLVRELDSTRKTDAYFLDAICPYVESVDYGHVLKANKIDAKTSLNDLVAFAMGNVSHWNRHARLASAAILKALTPGLIQRDIEQLMKRNESTEQQPKDDTEPDDSWHYLNRFKAELEKFSPLLEQFTADFNFKPAEVTDGTKDGANLEKTQTMSYLLLWDCILGVCAKSTPELRSIYASWISRHQFEKLLLPTLFKLMPQEVLRNPDSCAVYGQTIFNHLEWSQIKSPSLKLERYACYLYAQTLRNLPVIVRRWWNGLHHRHATIVNKITANCVSAVLCQDEFQALLERKDKQDNMQIKVHSATRHVMAVYSIDEAKLDLSITLPGNFPLGAVTVEGGKQIGDRLQSRQLVMQLSIFLTHQNGSIWDGLSLWKRNLDRKFEGVEECYVCYSVLHQDTCQLPKLSCKTCRKKFHGPCLYRWFSTSLKSTCPICRNIF